MTPIQYRNYLLNQPRTNLIIYNAKGPVATQVLI